MHQGLRTPIRRWRRRARPCRRRILSGWAALGRELAKPDLGDGGKAGCAARGGFPTRGPCLHCRTNRLRLSSARHGSLTGRIRGHRLLPAAVCRWQALIRAVGPTLSPTTASSLNLGFSPRRWAFIDRDLAAPGSRLGDAAYALHGFVPLGPAMLPARKLAHRLRMFCLDEAQRQEVILMLARRGKVMRDFLAGQAPPPSSRGPGHNTQTKAARGRQTPATSPNGTPPERYRRHRLLRRSDPIDPPAEPLR